MFGIGDRKIGLESFVSIAMITTGAIILMATLFLRPSNDERERFQRANQMFDEGQFDRAASIYMSLLASENPRILESAYYNLGNCQMKLGRLDEAISSYANCLLINPNKIEAKYNMEIAIRMKNDLLSGSSSKEREGDEPDVLKPGQSEVLEEFSADRFPYGEMLRMSHADEIDGPDW